jgi:hypothetical protein
VNCSERIFESNPSVSVDHPVAALLNHHLRDNIGSIKFAIEEFLQDGTIFDTVSGLGGVGAAKFIRDRVAVHKN